MAAHDHHDQHDRPAGGVVYEGPHIKHDHLHVTPALPMLIVFIILLVLTVVTVLTAKFIDLPGTGNLILALVIASIKGILVMAYFMHLKYDKGLPLVVVYSTFFGVVLFLGLTMADIGRRGINDELDADEIQRGGNMTLHLNAGGNLREVETRSGEAARTDLSIRDWAIRNAQSKAAHGKPAEGHGHADGHTESHGGDHGDDHGASPADGHSPAGEGEGIHDGDQPAASPEH